MHEYEALKSDLRARAAALGFEDLKICAPDAIPHMPQALGAFVANGHHGQMQWLADRQEQRADPRTLWPEVRSVITVAHSYTPQRDPRAVLKDGQKGAISVYAQNRDYHDVLKKRLKSLGGYVIERGGGEIKVFVDTAPVAEKPLAAAAGLGWQGKHTNLVSRTLGNWFFIGVIYSTLTLPIDDAEQDHCGTCRACIDACPTRAIVAPYRLDARLCISYLTIEHKGAIAPELRPHLGNRIYGCDDCLAACPWNKFAQAAKEVKYHARADLIAPDLHELADLDDAAFRAKFAKSPIKRIGRNRFVRNVLYAIGNARDENLLTKARALSNDPDPVVAEAAHWAVAQVQENNNAS